MATGQPPRPGRHRFSPSPEASHTLWRQPLPLSVLETPVVSQIPGPGRPPSTSQMGKARPSVKWPGQNDRTSRTQPSLAATKNSSRAQLSKPCRVRAQGSSRMGQGGPRMSTEANGGISWETDIPEWACQGLGTSQTLFSSIVHPTPTLQIKQLKASEVTNAPCSRDCGF